MDGKFWCLSEWPTGERDENHRCQFGQHCLEVDEEDGVVRPILVGGVGDYRVTLHLIQDDPNAEPDWDGWTVATCAPDMVDFALTDQAIVLGWTLDNSVPERPILIPPKTPPPAADTTEAAAEAPSAPAAPEVDAEAAEKD
jgi:hypothetical protein